MKQEEKSSGCRATTGLKSLFSFSGYCLIGVLFFCSVFPSSAQETVNPRTGRLRVTATDLIIAAGPVDLEIRRSLQSGEGRAGLLGAGWRLNFEKRLIKEEALVRIEGDAGTIFFYQEGSASDFKNTLGEQIRFEAAGRAVYVKRDGTRETYNSDGRLIGVDYRNNNRVSFSYGLDKRLSRIDGPRKHFLKLRTDDRGRIVRIESSNSDVISYQYENENLSEVRINGSLPIRYHYNTKDLLTRKEDPKTGAVEMAYDAQGRVLMRRFADGGEEKHNYLDQEREHQITNPSGGVSKRRWSPDGLKQETIDPLGHRTMIEYNPQGLPVTIIDPLNNKSELSYDKQGRLISLKDAAGRTTRYEYLKDTEFLTAVIRPDGSRLTYQYDVRLNLKEVSRGSQPVLQQIFNADGSVKSIKEWGKPEERFSYDQSGRLSTQGNALGQQTRFEYDSNGNLIRKINPLGGVSIFAYNNNKQLISLTDPARGTTRYEYNPRGLLAKTINPAGGITTWQYDSKGRLLALTDPSGGTTKNVYDPQGRIVQKFFPGGRPNRYSYDEAGNLTSETNIFGQTRQVRYDPLGRVRREITAFGLELTYEYDFLDNLISWKDSLGAGENFRYDLDGHLLERSTRQGAVTRYVYDPSGNLLSITDPLGRVKRFGYSLAGQLTEVKEPEGSTAGYTYDSACRLSTIKHPNGGESRFFYDPMGNLVSSINPLGQTAKMTYDRAGRLLAQTDAKGLTTTFTYDALGQLIGKQLPDGGKTAYQYDSSGKLVLADDGKFPVRHSYNELGLQKKVEYPAIRRTLTYTYDPSGLLSGLRDLNGPEIGYEYNASKQLSAIILPDGQKIILGYNAQNLLRSINYPNGISGQWDYDAAGRIVRIGYQDKKGDIMAQWTYAYDPAGNLVEQKDVQARASFYKYDQTGQLIEENDSGKKAQYRYSPGGNRSSAEEMGAMRGYQYDRADRIIKAGEENLFSDGNGNLINRKDPRASTSYEYNAENQLVKVSRSDGQIATFGYAPGGERVWRQDRQGLTYYLYDGFNLTQELGEKGNIKAVYVFMPGIDRPLAMVREGQSFFYHPDRLGSIRLLTDSQGKIAAAYDYDAFGKIRSQQGSISNPFTFTGREWEQDLGLYYYRARYYEPQIGRFLSPDALPPNLGRPFSLNPYLYARNNPVRFIDPLGLDWFDPIKNMGIWDTPEECLEYWRTIKARPGNPNYDTADQMIGSLENYIRQQGRAVPPPPNPAPAGGGPALGNPPGGRISGDTINIGSGPPKPSDTLSVRSGSSPSPTPGPGGITRPGFYGAVGGGLAAVGAAVNLQACLDEGKSLARCSAELGLGVIVGGSVVAGALALGVPATALAIGGSALAAGGAWLAGGRWSQAPETRALAEQQAAQQAQAEARVRNALANLQGQVGALTALGQEFCAAQSSANDRALKAKNAAEGAKRNLEAALGAINAEVTGTLLNGCLQDQGKLVNLPGNIKQAEDWISKAGQGYEEAIKRLSRCSSQKDIDDADYFLKGSTAMTLSAEKKVSGALADIEALTKSIPKTKDTVKSIREKMSNLENSYLGIQQTVDNFVSETETWAKKAEDKISQFNTRKSELLRSVENLNTAVPERLQGELLSVKAKIENTVPPCSIKSQDEYRNMARAAKESISLGLPSGVSGLGSAISMGAMAAQKLAIDNALNTCGSLNPSSGREADNASLALVKLGDKLNNWLKTIAEKRAQCKTKLNPKPTTPATAPTAQTGQSTTTTPTTPPVTPPPPVRPPATKTLTALAANCPTTASVGDTVQCSAVGIYEGGTPEDLTRQVSWTPYTSRFTVLRKPDSGFINVNYSFKGFSGTLSIMISEKTAGMGPAVPPPPPPPAPGTKKLLNFAWECYPKDQVTVGGSVQCKALAMFEGESELKDVTAQATWTPGASFKVPSVKPESGFITVTVIYWGERGTKTIKVVEAVYDPTKDPGLPGRDMPVDPDRIKGPMDGFAGGRGQGGRPEKPQPPPPTIIPPGYITPPAGETKPPAQPQKPPDQPVPPPPGGEPPKPPPGGDISGEVKPPQPPKPSTTEGGGQTCVDCVVACSDAFPGTSAANTRPWANCRKACVTGICFQQCQRNCSNRVQKDQCLKECDDQKNTAVKNLDALK